MICLENGGINSSSNSNNNNNNNTVRYLTVRSITIARFSDHSYFRHPSIRYDNMYVHVVQLMSISCSSILFLAYIIGIWFTLRTHAKLI